MPSIQRNIEVDPQTWSKLKEEAEQRNKNVRQHAGDILLDHVKKIGEKTDKKKMKAIIIAAGMSSRLMELTDELPKCMLEVNGKTLLQRQIEAFHACNIDDIVVIRGYKKEKINYTGVKYIYNKNYRRNNILESLMYAKAEMDSEFIATYSDIWFDKSVVKKLLKRREEISVVVDVDFRKAYEGRTQHPVEEAEKVVVEKGRVIRIAKALNPNETYGEFIGLMKFSEKGADTLKNTYHSAKKQYGIHTPFHTAPCLEKAYMTDIFQELIDNGNRVHCVDIRGGWIELDTEEDFEKAEKIIK